MTEYTIVIEKDEDGYYVGSVPGLPGCHTQGKSIDQLLERMEEAIALWLEVEGEESAVDSTAVSNIEKWLIHCSDDRVRLWRLHG